MGKIYIDTVKYVVHASVEITGLVEKPDVVGAIFGQTEGLLGEELDLRELQKNGRIGRIEVNLQSRGNKSIGNIEVPSSLDIVETAIIGAALETVDRVGPCEARISVDRVEDTRSIKRKRVIDRAKELVKKLITTEIPERKELSELVRAEVKTAEISTYGSEKLPSGPNIENSDSVILVEGRADVITMLKNDIDNVVAIGGANVPKTVVDLCRRKEATLFLDGDRGGDIILREVTNLAEVDYVARAPPGREVEELARKEIIKALRSRVPIEQVEGAVQKKKEDRDRDSAREFPRASPAVSPAPYRASVSAPFRATPSHQVVTKDIEHMIETQESAPVRERPKEASMPSEVLEQLSALEGSFKARFYDSDMKQMKEVATRDVTRELESTANVHAVVLDGIITQRLVDVTENRNIKVLAGIKMGNVFRKPERLQIYVKQKE
jgi:DNA primase